MAVSEHRVVLLLGYCPACCRCWSRTVYAQTHAMIWYRGNTSGVDQQTISFETVSAKSAGFGAGDCYCGDVGPSSQLRVVVPNVQHKITAQDVLLVLGRDIFDIKSLETSVTCSRGYVLSITRQNINIDRRCKRLHTLCLLTRRRHLPQLVKQAQQEC